MPMCSRLRKMHFILPSQQVDWDNCMGYVGRLLKTPATLLESLAFDLSTFHTHLYVPELFSDVKSLPALNVLRLPTATDVLPTPRAHALQCLQLNCDHSRIGRDGITGPGRRSLPPSLYPRLERLYCSHVDLPSFLPADTDARRPIHAVFLDEAVYGLDGGMGHSRALLPLLPFSSMALEEILRCLPNSAVPVTELSLYLNHIDVVELR